MTTRQTPDAVREAAMLAQAREAAAQAFDARAKKAGHPDTVTMERHHAKVIRQGEGDDYDAVQSALIALRLAALDSRAGDAGEGQEERVELLEAALATVRVNLMRNPSRHEAVGEFVSAVLRGETLMEAVITADTRYPATPAPAVDASDVARLTEALKRAAVDMALTPRHNRDCKADEHIEESRERIRIAISGTPAVDAVPAGEVTEAMVDAALNARLSGGTPVLAFLPSEANWTPLPLAREIVRCALSAALSHGEGR